MSSEGSPADSPATLDRSFAAALSVDFIFIITSQTAPSVPPTDADTLAAHQQQGTTLGDQQRTLLRLISQAHAGPPENASAAADSRDSPLVEGGQAQAEHDSDEEEEDLLHSLRAGIASRNRRRRSGLVPDSGDGMDRTDAIGAQDELVEDSGWRYLSRLARDDAEDARATHARGGREQEPELSPEEMRAMRTWLDSPERRDWLSQPTEEDEDQQQGGDPNLDEFAWRERELPSIWRNDPLSVPRTSALPRGGRNFRLPSSFSSSSATAAATPAAGPSTFSPSNPPPLASIPSASTSEQRLLSSASSAASNQNPRGNSNGIDLRTARVPRVYEPINFSTLRLPPHVQAALRDSPAARRAREMNVYAEEVQAGRASRLRRRSESGAESLGYYSSSDDDEEGEENTASNEREGANYVEMNGLRFRGLLRRSEAPEVPASVRVRSDTERMADLTRAGEAFFSSIPGRDRPRPLAQARDPRRNQNEHDSNSDSEEGAADPLAVFTNVSRTSPGRRRTREETNSLMGAALRSKKPVWLLYCGDDGSFNGGGERLPAGFRSRGNSDGGGEGRGGCGALVCSRALLDGVADKVFFDVPLPENHEDPDDEEGQEYPAASSDLPPRADRVADLERDGTGDWVGVRGSKKCGGCVTRDVACTRCGNILGYRLLKPCVRCSIPRPTYTTYASAVTNDPASPTTATTTNNSGGSGNPRPTLTAGGVTGGGVVDGLLFHFRLGAVTPVMRRVGIPPKEELPPVGERLVDEAREAEADGVAAGAGDGEEAGRADNRVTERHRRRALASLTTRIREPIPKIGERMLWKHIPSAQRDFLSGLVGEPSDWISPTSETWWLDHAIVKHSRKRSAGAAFANSNRDFNPDSLSSARTSTEQSGGISRTSPANSPLRSSLSRSHAIRMRVPLSNAHPASALAAAGGGGSETAAATTLYDRYRHDASDFARRVRQRYADPSASDSAVVTSLERAGYGSGFAEEDGDDGGGAAGAIRLRRGRDAIGR
ncbi:hypothetical protein JCM10908_006771 [Rhodotorula pacifica]|uniref:uncharacterized protein n=1 Tax=Rhodotorula pacifica TaxID=1495444 RepID=UPI003170395F